MKSSMLIAIILFMGLPAKSQINSYEVAEMGFLCSPKEAANGIVATNNRNSEIYLVSGKEVRTLYTGLGCGAYTKLSKDGKTLGFKSITDDYKQAPAIIDIETGKVTLLEQHSDIQCGQVSFSDDGTMVYTVGNNLVIRNGENRRYIDLGEYVNIVNISPDGKSAAYSNINGESFIVDLATGYKEVIEVQGTAPYEPVWSPDSKKLAYQKVDGTLTVVDRFSRANYQLGRGVSVIWDADSRNLYFSRPEGAHEMAITGASVVKTAYNGANMKVLSTSSDYPYDLCKTRDGGLLVSYATGAKKGLSKMKMSKAIVSEEKLVSIGNVKFGKRLGLDLTKVKKVIPTASKQTADGPMREGSIGALDIPYINQVWDTPSSYDGNYRYGYVCCAPSSSCMLLGYYKMLTPKAVTSRASGVGTVYYSWYVGRDYTSPKTGYTFNKRASGNGSSNVGGGYGYMWNSGSPNSTMHNFYKNNGMKNSYFESSWATFCKESSANRPYTICLKNGTGGHVVLGFRSNSQADSRTGAMSARTGSFVCHDPYGDYNAANYPNWDGRYSTYDWPGYSNGHANIGVFYWGCVAIPPETVVKNPTLTVSKSSLHFECIQGEHPTLSFTVTGKDLDNDITVGSITPGRFKPDKTNLGKTGGTVNVQFLISDAVGTYGKGGTAVDYDFFIRVKSGSLEKVITITANVKPQPLNMSEKWNFSEQKNTKTQKGWDASKVRNFAYMNGKLYCVYNHTDIKVINAQTGEDLGNLDKTGVGGGTLAFCDVKAIDGHVVACNLATSGKGESLTLYAWDSDNAVPYVLYKTSDLRGATRLGDCMELSGSWANLCVTFANDDGSTTRIIEYHKSRDSWSAKTINATTDGSTQLKTSSTTRAYTKSGGWWIDGKDCQPTWMTNNNGVAVMKCSVNTGETWGASHHEFNWKGNKYAANLVFNNRVAGEATSTYKAGRMRFTIDEAGDYSKTVTVGDYPSAGLGSTSRNTGCTGDCYVNTDGNTYVEAWVCSTTQGMAYYNFGSVPSYNPQPIKPAGSEIKASSSSVSISGETWSESTASVTISGTNLTGDITLALSGADAEYFRLSTETIAKNTSSSVTIKYYPKQAGTHSATLTATSTGAEPVSVSITGNATQKMEFDDNVTKMTEVWNYSGNTSVPSWMNLTDPPVRSIAFQNGKLYVLHGKPWGEPVVKIIDAYTGAYKGDLNMDGLASSLLKISSIISFDGKLFASSLSATNHALTVYRWDSDTSKPIAVVSDATHGGVECGATLSASGNLQNGRFWINNQNTDRVMYYTISNGSVSSTPQTIMLKNANGTTFAGGDGRGSAEVVATSDGSFWLAAKDVVPTLFNSSGVAQKTMNISALNGNYYGTAMKIFNFGKRKYVAATTYKSVNTNGGFVLVDVTNGIESAEKSNFFYPEKGLGSAGNDQRVTSICQSTRNSGGILDIWVCVKGQGVAYYTYEGGKPSGVEGIVEQSEAKLVYNGSTVSVVGADVARISVFSTSGLMVADVQNENELNVMPLVKGIYIVRAVDIDGNVLTTKFIKR